MSGGSIQVPDIMHRGAFEVFSISKAGKSSEGGESVFTRSTHSTDWERRQSATLISTANTTDWLLKTITW